MTRAQLLGKCLDALPKRADWGAIHPNDVKRLRQRAESSRKAQMFLEARDGSL